MTIRHEDIYKPHANQLKLHLDKHRYRVVVAGRRFGKSAFGINEALVRILGKKNQLVWIILPTYKQARQIYWLDPDILKYFMPYVQAGVLKKNDFDLSLTCSTTGSLLQLKGADNPDSLRGSGLDLLVWDEAAKVKPIAFDIVRPSLADSPNHKGIYIGTPQGFNHFHDYALKGDSSGIFTKAGKNITPDPEWSSWHFTSYDNLAWEEGSFEKQKFVEYIEKEKMNNTPDWFNQEYLAQFTRFTGLIYKEFSELEHVDSFEHVYNQHGDYYFGLDPAVRGWVAAIASWVKPDGHIYHLDNYKKEGLTAQEHAASIKAMLTTYAPLEKWTGYADPSGFAKNQQGKRGDRDMVWSLADEYIDAGLPLVPGNNEVVAGINFVRQLHRDNKIHVHPRCRAYIDEKLQYQWEDQPETQIGSRNIPEKPRKFNDHLMDAERYECYSKPTAPEEEEKPRTTTFPGQFVLKLDEPDPNEDKITPIDIPSYYDD